MADFVIEIQNEENYAIVADRLVAAGRAVLSHPDVIRQDITDGSRIVVAISTDEAVTALNRQFRGIDAPTDVLSFPTEALPDSLIDALGSVGDIDEDEIAPYLGDIVIAYPYAKAQAEREGHEIADSLALLVIHGTLHLLGYDHDTPEHREAMWTVQNDVLDDLDLPLSLVPALEDEDEGIIDVETERSDADDE